MASKNQGNQPRNDFEILRNEIGWSNPHIAKRCGCTATVVDRWAKNGTAPDEVMRFLEGVAAFLKQYSAPTEWKRKRKKPVSLRFPIAKRRAF